MFGNQLHSHSFRSVAILFVTCCLCAVTNISRGAKHADQRPKTGTGRRPGWSDHLSDSHYVDENHNPDSHFGSSGGSFGQADASMELRLKYARELALPYLSSLDRRLRVIEKAEHAKGKVPVHYSFDVRWEDVQQMRVMLAAVENTNAGSPPADVSKALANIHGLSSWWSMLVGNIRSSETPNSQECGWFFGKITPSAPTAAFAVLIAQILLMLMLIFCNHWQVSFGKQILCAFVTIFVLSIPWNWLRLRERKQAEQLVFVKRQELASAARTQCVRLGKREKVWNYLYSLVGVAPASRFDDCEEDTMSSYGTAEYQVSPIEAMWETTRQILIVPLEQISESLSKILRGLFSHLPVTLWPLMTTIMAIVAIIFLLLFILRMFLSHGYRLRLPWFFVTLEPTPNFLPHFHHQHQQLPASGRFGVPGLSNSRPQEAIAHAPATSGWPFRGAQPSLAPTSSSLMESRFASGDHLPSQPMSYDDEVIAACTAAGRAAADAVRSDSSMRNRHSSARLHAAGSHGRASFSASGSDDTEVMASSATTREQRTTEFVGDAPDTNPLYPDLDRPNRNRLPDDLAAALSRTQSGGTGHLHNRTWSPVNKIRKRVGRR